uniref:O-fucosyltransferase family protein n=1 Tax=Aplanochytrium stocchinoi TaxID=215587 RepID=A0A7S3LNV6_9STRA|mmetsp:Transcript_5080/g.5992  ORF Transcript_5080/g.5992 Transcript_5080/m.5992 type:complete len:459 (+) Transcript_5080:184-1560(+)
MYKSLLENDAAKVASKSIKRVVLILVCFYLIAVTLTLFGMDKFSLYGQYQGFVNGLYTTYATSFPFKEDCNTGTVDLEAVRFKRVRIPVINQTSPSNELELVLDRTTDIPYNDVLYNNEDKSKYFVYQPSGGMNNQRIELEAALLFANKLGRNLIVPMAGKHSSISAYMRLKPNELVPMDVIFDFKYISRDQFADIKLVPINMTLPDFIKQLRRKFPEDCSDRTFNRAATRDRVDNTACGTYGFLKAAKAQKAKRFLIYEGHFYCHYFRYPEQADASRYMRYNPILRSYTLLLLKNTFKAEGGKIRRFNAFHSRRGDYKNKLGYMQGYAKYQMKKKDFDTSVPMYIATEPTESIVGFDKIKKRFSTYFYRDLNQTLMKAFRNTFRSKTKSTINDMFGVIEQLIGTYAEKFQGTNISTFSKFIVFMRNNRNLLFPETASSEDDQFYRFNKSIRIKFIET